MLFAGLFHWLIVSTLKCNQKEECKWVKVEDKPVKEIRDEILLAFQDVLQQNVCSHKLQVKPSRYMNRNSDDFVEINILIANGIWEWMKNHGNNQQWNHRNGQPPKIVYSISEGHHDDLSCEKELSKPIS